MAKPAIKPEKAYRVKLARPTEIAPGTWARPHDEVILSGDTLTAETAKGNVESYEEA